MSTKTKGKISKTDLADMNADLSPAVQQNVPNSSAMTMEEFLKADGETFGGLNILRLGVGQAAGKFTVTKVEKGVKLSKKIKGTTDRYTARTVDGLEIGMPVSASFVDKARAAKLAVGDVIAVLRGDDYESKFGRGDCHSYSIKVFKS